jgi:hypothetical protein
MTVAAQQQCFVADVVHLRWPRPGHVLLCFVVVFVVVVGARRAEQPFSTLYLPFAVGQRCRGVVLLPNLPGVQNTARAQGFKTRHCLA